MKIIQCITRSEKGGAQIDTAALLSHYPNYNQVLVTGEEGWLTEYSRSIGTETFVIPSLVRQIAPVNDLRTVFVLRDLFRDLRPDLVHLHTAKAGLTGRIAAQLCDIPSVYTPHGWAFSPRSKGVMRVVSEALERLARPLSDVVIAVSEDERRLAIKKGVCPADKIQTIYNGLTDTSLQRQHQANAIPVLAMVSRFAPPKRQADVVRALSQSKRDFKLLLVGDGPTRSHVESVAAACGLGRRAEFLGVRHDIEELLSKTDILVHASHYEALCLSVVEAMRASLPVVAWATGGIEELVTQGVTGYLAANANEFTEFTEGLLADVHLRERLGQAGRQKFLSFLTLDDTLRKTSQLYEVTVAAKKLRGRDASLVENTVQYGSIHAE